ncbi:T9SS sorting signal type C domain-containing protein, partial [uncultured Flavobacterium sp.]|uniref:T9SS sorting signal type C domain-containing protein n=1 Tax=uncultured Flavobacterium sp. TaxID=165435 RepID=UPI0030EE6CA8
ITAPAALCSAGSLNPTAPTVTANGSLVTASGWQLETGVGSGAFANLTVPYTVAFVDNGKKIRYYATNGCGTTNGSQVVITVNNSPTVAAITAPATLCSGGFLNPTAPTVTANGSLVTASGWELETGVGSGSFANLTVPYTVVFADNGKNIRYYATNGCGTKNSNQVTLKVEDVLAAPTPGTKTQPNCVISTGSVELSGLPSGSWTINPGGLTGSGSTTTITGLVAGKYNFTVTNSTGCISGATGNVVINSAVTNTWNGTVWSNGTPTLSDKIVFSGNYPPASDPNVDIEGCSCKVTGSTTVVFKAGLTLKITNEVIVQSNATLTFESGASLVQINDTPSTPNSGDIIYKRETSLISNFDYTYWSSPVASQTLYNLSPNTLGDKFYSFDSGIDNWRQENSANTMAIGTGYIVRGPQNYSAPTPPSAYLASFIGVPNNGVKNTAIGVAGNSNLIGNPYPSALDADSFLTANNGVLEGTIYFWTHNTNIGIGVSNPGSGIYAYSSDDYAAYNLTGGVATQAPSSSNAGAVNSNAPSGKIASGQAFFGTSIASGNAVFKNNMRVGVGSITGVNSQFFKNASNTKAVTTVEKDRLWLNLYNMQDAFKQTLVGYVTGATNEYDSAFDGESFDSNEFLDFYSINQDKNLVIQGRALPFDQADEVPLGYSSTIVGDFQIGIGQVDGSFVDKDVFLEDKLLNTTHNLKNSPYLFKTESGVFNDRFIIKYTNKTLATDEFEDIKYGILISNKNKVVLIKSSDELIDKVFVYDFSGKQLYKKHNVDNYENKILNLGPIDQALIVKVILQSGKTVNKKIVY